MSSGFVALFRSIFKPSQTLAEKTTPVQLDISSGNKANTIYAGKATAAILDSVFAQSPPANHINPTDGTSPTETAQSAAAKIRVGEDLRLAKDRILSYGAEISKISDEATQKYADSVLSIFDVTICNIAILGQMNSGKSTLINAFIERPDLLPSEITPWTTVVTNLYFGVPDTGGDRAVFEFFNADEWQRLAEGSARLRELTERLIPNFDWAAFYRQVGDMREKARQKLGPRFEDLLGKRHGFPEITPGLLRKYVCAEPALGGSDEFGTGEFSLITKAANLYFGLGGFFYPTLVIDTPGINDPFLVRDEITRQNLERANIFIIVVTARQPLSNADVDLLRILRGLDKDRIIVFVNKIDEVEDFPEFEDAILQRVKGVLEKEFPSARIPVIVGCARWAVQAQSAESGEPLPEIPASLRPSAREIAALSKEDKGFWGFDRSVQEMLAAEEVLMRSGVPALALAVSEMMQTGPIADCLKFSTVALTAIAANWAACTDANAEMLARLLESSRSRKILDKGEMAKIREGLRQTEEIANGIRELVTASQSRGKDLITTGFSALRHTLSVKLEYHLAAVTAPRGDQQNGAYASGQSVNVMPLRAALEQEFAQGFHRIYQRIVDLTRDAETRIQERVERIRNDNAVAIVYLRLPVLKLTPPLSALAEPIALASGGTIQAEWWRQSISPEERASRFRELIRTQFISIIDKLCAEGAQEITSATDFVLNHFRMSVLHCVDSSTRARRAKLDDYLALFTGDKNDSGPGAERLAKDLDQLNAKAGSYRRISAELAQLRE
jgi:GTP-binding protein EngB required for normal cell division